ncbi:hypothetical protein [Marinobacter sp. PE14]
MRSRAIHRHQSMLQCGKDVRFVRNLASALTVAMNITPGNQLVMALGAGDERSNTEALETWVQFQLVPLRGMTNQQLLAELIERLERQLADHLEAGQ